MPPNPSGCAPMSAKCPRPTAAVWFSRGVLGATYVLDDIEEILRSERGK